MPALPSASGAIDVVGVDRVEHLGRCRPRDRGRPRARVRHREVHRLRARAVGARGPVLAAVRRRANEAALVRPREQRIGADFDGARRAVDALDDVLRDRRPRPQELARCAIERVDEPRLAGDAGHDAALFAAAQARIDPRHLARVGCDGRVDQHALERMIEVPMIDGVLVVPDRLARRGPQRERRVVIEVLLVVAGEHELRRRRRDRGADVDEVELGVVARDHPRADVPTLVVGHVAPAVAARARRVSGSCACARAPCPCARRGP